MFCFLCVLVLLRGTLVPTGTQRLGGLTVNVRKMLMEMDQQLYESAKETGRRRNSDHKRRRKTASNVGSKLKLWQPKA